MGLCGNLCERTQNFQSPLTNNFIINFLDYPSLPQKFLIIIIIHSPFKIMKDLVWKEITFLPFLFTMHSLSQKLRIFCKSPCLTASLILTLCVRKSSKRFPSLRVGSKMVVMSPVVLSPEHSTNFQPFFSASLTSLLLR